MSGVVFCPSCGMRYSVAPSLLEGAGLLVLCGACAGGFRVDELGIAIEEAAAAAKASVDLEQRVGDAPVARVDVEVALLPRVVVGHEVPSAQRAIGTVLREAKLAPVCVATGEQVLQACDAAMPTLPDAVVLDVGIPGVMAFEVIEQLRRQPYTAKTPVVLLASVFEKTRYKRRPNRLYGADAYLELHHVPDRLADMLHALLANGPIPEERRQAPLERARAAGLRGPSTADDEAGARMLARRLLSDVALYHGSEIAAGLRSGAPFGAIGAAIDDARRLHAEGAPAAGARATFDEELAAFEARLLERTRERKQA